MDEPRRKSTKKPSRQLNLEIPHVRDFIAGVIEEFGGAKLLAKEYVACYRSCKQGGPTRAQLMTNLSKLLFSNTVKFGEQKNAEEMSDEELIAVVARALGKETGDE